MSGETRPKSFDDLVREVHEQGTCGECGGCVSFCSAHDLKAIKMPGHGPPVYANEDACLHCGICYLVCPQTRVMGQTLDATFDGKKPGGTWRKVASCKATSTEIASAGTDGGVVTALLMFLLDHKQIDGAIVSKSVSPFQRVSFFAKTKKDLIDAAGSSFTMAGNVVALERYSTFIPTVSALESFSESDKARVALVGTPCQVHSLRKMQALRVLPSHVVKYVFGLFCNMNFSFDDASRQAMEQEFGFSASEVERMNIREHVTLDLKNNETVTLTFEQMQSYARPACMACADFSNVYADISFGGVGSDPGFTSVMVRTEAGEKLFQRALSGGYVTEPANKNSPVDKSILLARVLGSCKEKAGRAAGFFHA